MPDRPRVLITRRICEPAPSRLAESCDVDVWEGEGPPERDVLLERVRGAAGLLTMLSDRVDAELMDAAGPQLKVVANYAVGFNNIDVAEAARRGIAVGNTPDVLTDATADIAFALLIAAARRIVESEKSIHAGQWTTWEPLGFIGRDLVGKTLGVVGFGRIGQAMARRCHGGWGMKVLYTSRSPKPEAETSLRAERVELEALLEASDFVSVHCNLTDQTRGLFGESAFRRMKSSAIFINTSRGEVHDQPALVRALSEGQIAAAGLDVTNPEPPAAGDPLLDLANCVVTPHIGSATEATRAAMSEIAADNILAGIAGKPLRTPVSPS